MRRPPMLSTALLVGALAATVPAEGTFAQQVHRLSGGRVAVYNLAGRVDVVRGSGPDVVVTITTGGADAGQLRVETGPLGGRETFRVIYPSDRVVVPGMGRRSRSTVRVRPDGTFGDGRGGETVRIGGSGSGLEARADLRVEVPAGTELEVYLAVGESELRGVDGRVLVDLGAGSVDAATLRGTLEVDTGSGSVTVRDVEGDVLVDTGSGRIELASIRGERLVAESGSGTVRGTDLTAGSVHVDTGSGSIVLGRLAALQVLVETGSGSVEVDLTSPLERLEVDTGSGSVTVRLPSGVGAEVEVRTGSGGIDADLPVQVRSMRRNRLVGTVGDGRGSIRIETRSGRVRLTGA